MNEENFLSLYKFTRSDISPEQFFEEFQRIMVAEKTKSVNFGADYVLAHWRESTDKYSKIINSL